MEVVTTQQYVPAVAERGKFFPLDRSYLDSIGYPTSGEGKYCVLTYNVSPITIDIAGSDIQIGAVELKDADSLARVKIAAADTMPTSANAIAVADANVLNALTGRFGPITLATDAESQVPQESTDVSNFHNYTFHVFATGVTSGATIEIESSIDGSHWVSIASLNITASGNYEVAISQQAYAYLRSNITSRTDGLYTIKLYCGN